MNSLSPLRIEVETAVLDRLERAGPKAEMGELVQSFAGRGASRPTLYRWVAGIVKTGRGGAHLTAKLRDAAAARAARTSDPARDAADEIETSLPTLGRSGDVLGGGVLEIMEKLHVCMGLAEGIITKTRNPDGSIRLVKTALAASEHIRRCLETSVRVADAIRQISRIDAFHASIIDEIALESPECAERILVRLKQFHVSWIDR
jgi:hypothetical protein